MPATKVLKSPPQRAAKGGRSNGERQSRGCEWQSNGAMSVKSQHCGMSILVPAPSDDDGNGWRLIMSRADLTKPIARHKRQTSSSDDRIASQTVTISDNLPVMSVAGAARRLIKTLRIVPHFPLADTRFPMVPPARIFTPLSCCSRCCFSRHGRRRADARCRGREGLSRHRPLRRQRHHRLLR